MIKILRIAGFFSLLILSLAPLFTGAQVYKPLAPLPIITNENGTVTIASFLPGIYKLAVGVASVIAVVIIVLAGFKYMTSEGGKTAAKKSIQDALVGLLMLLSSYLLLNTINPELLKLKLDLGSGGPALSPDFVAIAKANGAFSGFTPSLVQKMEDARKEYERLIATGDNEAATDFWYNTVTDVNFEKAMNLADGATQKDRDLALATAKNMNDYYAQYTKYLIDNGKANEAYAVETRQLIHNATFKETSKMFIMENDSASGALNAREARKEITQVQSEVAQTYSKINAVDPAAAAAYKTAAEARIQRMINSLTP